MRGAVLALLAGSMLAMGSTAASAAVQFTGTTQGCFGAACVPGGPTATDAGLLYTVGGFNQTSDASGFLGVGGTSDNLGSFALGPMMHTYTGDLFTLLINFTSPGVGNSTFQALLKGTVTDVTHGSVFIDFDNTPQLVMTPGGNFTVQVNDVSLTPGILQILSGQLQAVPEPSTWAMMLLGFGGIGMAMRRRRRPALAQIA